jgi:hypothetical protein
MMIISSSAKRLVKTSSSEKRFGENFKLSKTFWLKTHGTC